MSKKQLDKVVEKVDETQVSYKDFITITDDEINNHLESLRTEARQFQETRSTKREMWDKYYHAKPYGNERDGYSQTIKTVIWDIVQGAMPGLMEIFTGDFFSLKSKQAENAEKLLQLIKYQLLIKNNGISELDGWIQNCLTNEFGVLKVYYTNGSETDIEVIKEEIDQTTFDELNKEFTITKYTPVDYPLEDGSIVTMYKDIKLVKEIITYAGPKIENIPLNEFFISPGCKTIDDAPYVGHWVKRTLDYIKRRESTGKYRKGSFDAIVSNLADSSTADPSISSELNTKYRDEELGNSLSAKSYTNPDEAKPNSEVWLKEEYVKLDLDNDGLLENAIIVSCGDVILSISENPYKRAPFRLGRIFPEPHKITGKPYTEILDYDQRMQTNMLRFLNDAVAMSTYKNPITNNPILFRALQDRQPGEAIRGNPDQISYVDVPPPSPVSFNFLEFAQTMVENKTGVTRYNQGLDADSMNKTATGIQVITSAAQQKQKLIAKRLGYTLEQVVRDFIFINQTWPPEDVVEIVGSNYVIDPSDLRGEYHVEVNIGNGPQEKLFGSQRIDMLIQMLMSYGIPNGLSDIKKLREAIDYKGKLEDIPYDRFMFTEEEILNGQNQSVQMLNNQMQQMNMQFQQVGQENASLKQQLGSLNKVQIEAQAKQAEIQAQMQIEKYKADLQAELALQKARIELNTKKEIELMKIKAEQELEVYRNSVVRTDGVI